MAAVSQAVKRLGKTRCELCNRQGTERNPLTRHHADGNSKNNDKSNFMVVHRILCHTFSDYITQWYMSHNKKATPAIIKKAWQTFNWED